MRRPSNSDPDVPGERRPAVSGKAWLGYLIAAASLLWVVHDVRWGELGAQLARVNWWLLAPAVLADVASYLCQGVRWSFLLRPLGRLSPIRATQAIYCGLFVNEVVPLRLGEVLRGYLVGKWMSLALTPVYSSIAVERFLDGVWLVLAIGIVLLGVPLPAYLVRAEEILAAVIFAGAGVLILLAIRGRRRSPGARATTAASGLLGGIRRSLARVSEGLGVIGGAPSFFVAAGFSGLVLALQILAFWLVMIAYHIDLSIWQGAAVMLVVYLGTTVPGAPSNLGTYQFFTVVGLTLFGVERTLATGFSFLVFAVLTVPLWAIGLYALSRAGLDLHTVRSELASLMNRRGAATESPR